MTLRLYDIAATRAAQADAFLIMPEKAPRVLPQSAMRLMPEVCAPGGSAADDAAPWRYASV